MAIVDSVARLAATLIGILHTRLELMSVEVEEELTRFSAYLLWSLVALFCAGVAVLLLILLLIAAFWDSYRMVVLLSLLAVFSGAAIGLGWWLRHNMLTKPRLLANTLAELRKDASALRGSSHTDESL
ncbi:phage holin family protein [Undibacterium sp. Jales W-56]|uniref:phage holin family protein n=1 Tax=Undibacterium sp. Jales W-56 TaxID=2897325 RepID=UPI0021D04D3A|nr:phage holin family protein [Undibacterium sp. Jales W-56]MCU6432412.1 phage holin family protein [Undibacterium sp. Jales W-56]